MPASHALWDEEEDLIAARLAGLDEEREAARQAGVCSLLLSGLRQRRAVQDLNHQGMSAATTAANTAARGLRRQDAIRTKHGMDCGDASDYSTSFSDDGSSSSSSSCVPLDLHLWHLHDVAWDNLLQSGKPLLSLAQLPWPPSNTGVLAHACEVELAKTEGPADLRSWPQPTGPDMQASPCTAKASPKSRRDAAMRHVYRKAMLRWHPDKLTALLLRDSPLSQQQQDNIFAKAARVLAAVQEEWSQHVLGAGSS